MHPLRAWPFRRVFWAALTWIVIVQIILFRRTFTTVVAIVRTHPETNLYSYLSSRGPPVPGAGLIVIGPPLIFVAAWLWMRRRKSVAD